MRVVNSRLVPDTSSSPCVSWERRRLAGEFVLGFAFRASFVISDSVIRFLFPLPNSCFLIPFMNEELLAKCSCSQCGNHIQFPIDAANAVVDCPHCNQKTQLTLDAPSPQPGKPSAADILAAFN